MTGAKSQIENISFNTSRPTTLTFAKLADWVIWQFPRKGKEGLCGAVHPPIAAHGWYPAVILTKEKRVKVYAQVKPTFPSPEAAADYIYNSPDEGSATPAKTN